MQVDGELLARIQVICILSIESMSMCMVWSLTQLNLDSRTFFIIIVIPCRCSGCCYFSVYLDFVSLESLKFKVQCWSYVILSKYQYDGELETCNIPTY